MQRYFSIISHRIYVERCKRGKNRTLPVCPRGFRRRFRTVDGVHDLKAGAFARCGDDRDVAAEYFNDRAADGKPQPDALRIGVGFVETLEYPAHVLLRNAFPRILTNSSTSPAPSSVRYPNVMLPCR